MIKVLVVDDDAAILQTMVGVLELEGLEVTSCSTAADAVSHLASDTFDLVITDMRMETPNAGCLVVGAAAAHPIRPVVVVLTAFPISTKEMRTLGAEAVLLKGSNPELFLQRLRRIISGIQTHTAMAATII
jgi:CheY-like chemotaxis protein